MEQLNNAVHYLYNAASYLTAGIGFHSAGSAAEYSFLILSAKFEKSYYHVPRIIASKLIHEVVESIFSSSAVINIYNNQNGIIDALYHIIEPLSKSFYKTLSSGISSFAFESFVSTAFLSEPIHQKNFYLGCGDNCCDHNIFTTTTLIKGAASICGSLFGALVYDNFLPPEEDTALNAESSNAIV